MTDKHSGIQTVEDFGFASGRLADPFADRHAILTDFGLDETAWSDCTRRFGARLGSAKDDAAVLRSFRESFERGRSARASRSSAAEPLPSPKDDHAEAV